MGRLSRGLALVSRDGPQREAGLDLFTQARDAAVTERFSLSALTIVDPEFAMEKARTGDLDGAIEMARAVVDGAYESGDMIWRGRATAVLVELLVRRGSAGDQHEAQAVIDRLAAVPTDPGFVLHELPLLRSRALLARAQATKTAAGNFMERHRANSAASSRGRGFAERLRHAMRPPDQPLIDCRGRRMPEVRRRTGRRRSFLGRVWPGWSPRGCLADFFGTVTVVERDLLPDDPAISAEGCRRVGMYMFCCSAARRSWMSCSPDFSMSW